MTGSPANRRVRHLFVAALAAAAVYVSTPTLWIGAQGTSAGVDSTYLMQGGFLHLLDQNSGVTTELGEMAGLTCVGVPPQVDHAPDGTLYGFMPSACEQPARWGRFDLTTRTWTGLQDLPLYLNNGRLSPSFLKSFGAPGTPIGYRFHPADCPPTCGAPLELYAVDALSPYREHLLPFNGPAQLNVGLGTVVHPDGDTIYYVTTDTVYKYQLSVGGMLQVIFPLRFFRITPQAVVTSFDNTGTYFDIINRNVRIRLDVVNVIASSPPQPLATLTSVDGALIHRFPWGGVRIEPHTELVTSEDGATAAFTAVLSSPPLDDVTVSFTSTDPGEGTVSPGSVVFTQADWNVERTITVTGVADNLKLSDEGASQAFTIETTATSADGNYEARGVVPVSISNTSINQLPKLTAGAGSVRQGMLTGTTSLGTVSDAETSAENLLVSALALPPGVGLGIIDVTFGGGLTAPISASCVAPTGPQNVTLRITDEESGQTDADAPITVLPNLPPTIGTYSPVLKLTQSTDVTVGPTIPPSDTSGSVTMQAAAPGFLGTLATNSSTGGVRIMGAKPAGAYTVTVTTFDNCKLSTTRTFPLTVCAAIDLGDQELADGHAGSPYSATLAQTGGVGLTTFARTAGALPAGMTLSSTGLLSGTPTEKGTFTFTVTATDENECEGNRDYTLNIGAAILTLSPASLAPAVAGAAFPPTSITQSGGVGTATFAVTSGAPPNGMAVSNAGVLDGTPTEVGTFIFGVTATDQNGDTGTGSFSLAVNCQAITVSPLMLANGTTGAAYSASILQTGGLGTTNFTVTAGTLPAGLTLSSSGQLSGTPEEAGPFSFTATATDQNSCSGAHIYTVVVNCPAITVAPGTLAGGTANAAYPATPLSQTGGSGSASFAITGGALPAGMTLASGVLSGTPAQTGVFGFTVTATDQYACTGTRAYTLAVACQAISVSPSSLPAGTAGTAYAPTAITESGGIGTSSFAVTSGALPAGMTLSPSGVLSGTPSATGTFGFTVTVSDANACTGARAYSLSIGCPAIVLSNTTLPGGTAGTAYTSTALSQSGGVGTATFAVAGGALPAGMTLSSTGALTGTPTQTGTFTFTVTATDQNGCTGTRSYTITIGCPAILVTPASLLNGALGVAYPATPLGQSGGVGVTSFAVTGGALPDGMTLSSGGVLSGTPTAPGRFTFTVGATDANSCGGSRTYTLIVGCPLTLTGGILPQARRGVPYSAAITATGSRDAVSFVVHDGTMPAGLTLGSDGSISGTPTANGRATLTIAASTVNDCNGNAIYTLNVGAPRWLATGPDAGGAASLRTFDGSGAPALGPLASLLAASPSYTGGVRVAVGDVNGDGVFDLIGGAGPGVGPIVAVFDGATGGLLHTLFAFDPHFTGGVYVAAGDVTGDGLADVIVGAGEGGGPVVRVFDARTGVGANGPLGAFAAYTPSFTGGVRVAAGDVNGDGRADIITGAGPGGLAHVRAWDGATGGELGGVVAYNPLFTGGVYVAAGDVNGDGYADVITGAGAGGGPQVNVYDGHTGAQMQSFFAYAPTFTGGVRVAAGDVTGDGRAEIIAAAGPGGAPQVSVFDPTTASPVATFMAYAPSFSGGVFVAAPGPLSRLTIDLLTPNQTTPRTGIIGGWALHDTGAGNTTGISAVEAWAQPIGGGAPVLLGRVTPDQPKPDVAAIYGGQFQVSGFRFETLPVLPGSYDIVIRALSSPGEVPVATRSYRVMVP